MTKKHNYQLREQYKGLIASDIVIGEGDVVELDEREAEKINAARDEPVLERVDGGDVDDEPEDDGGDE